MVTLIIQNNIQKKTNEKYEVKAEISMETISLKDSAKRLAFSAGQRPNDTE